MSEIRKNNITGEMVVMAPSRYTRPRDNFNKEGICPFCVGNEHLTPNEIYTSNKNLHKDSYWSVRVFPNKYPAVRDHEVIVDTPHHDINIHNFKDTQIEELLTVIKYRILELEKQPEIKYVQVFKNEGKNAGASRSHSHWQIIGLPDIPKKQQIQNNICPYCEQMESEIQNKERIIDHNQCFIAFAPKTSRFPLEINILPKNHIADISLMDENHIKELSAILKDTLSKLNNLIPEVAYNICFLGAANNSESKKNNHWQLQIIPRIISLGGFELATGCYINEILPEEAAKSIKNADAQGGFKSVTN